MRREPWHKREATKEEMLEAMTCCWRNPFKGLGQRWKECESARRTIKRMIIKA